MAKHQWIASSEAGASPALLDSICEGSLANWEIVTRSGALGGKTCRLKTGLGSVRRRLALAGVSVPLGVRIQMRGRFYHPSEADPVSLHFCFVRGTAAAEGTQRSYYCDVSTSSNARINYHSPSFTNANQAAVPSIAASWCNFEYTYSPTNPRHTLKFWTDAMGEGEAVSFTSNLTATVEGDRVGFGTLNPAVFDEMNWFTVGTEGDNADTVPTMPAPTTAPTIGTITPAVGGASVAFSDFPAEGSELHYRIDGGSPVTAGSTASPLVITGQTAATEYDVEIRATNAAGNGPWSTLATYETLASGTPISFTGTVPDQTGQVGVPFSLDLAPYFSGTDTPFSYATLTSSLPAGLSLNASTAQVTGTPSADGVTSGYSARGTDAGSATADTNTFSFTIDPAPAQTIISDFERSSVDLSLSSVGTDVDGPLITVQARRQTVTTAGTNTWLEPVFKVTGLNGVRPRIKIVPYQLASGDNRNTQTWTAAQRAHFSYDGETWTPIASKTTNPDLTWRHDTAFTEDTVWFARSWPRSVTQVGEQVEDLAAAHPTLIAPTITGEAFTPTLTSWPAQAFIVGEIGAKTNELSQSVPATPLYGFVIDDAAYGPKDRVAVVTMGIHAGEDVGELVGWEFLHALCADTPAARALRSVTRIVVYPLVNPSGRYAGYWRGAPGSNTDPNREWRPATTPTPTHDFVGLLRDTIIPADVESLPVAWSLDVHATTAGGHDNRRVQLGIRDDQPISGEYYALVQAAYPAGSWGRYEDPTTSDDSTTYRTLRGWMRFARSAAMPMLVETSDIYGPVSPANAQPYAQAMVSALHTMYMEGDFGDPPAVPEYEGGVAAMAVQATISIVAGTYTAPVASYAGTVSSMTVQASIAAVAGSYTPPVAPPTYAGSVAPMSVQIGLPSVAGSYLPPYVEAPWRPTARPIGRRLSRSTR